MKRQVIEKKNEAPARLLPLIVVLGPTASGKSDLAASLALKLNGQLVSADSRQIYKGMDIGTAKLKPPRGVKQWMVDIVPPNRVYTLKEYQQDAMAAIGDIHSKGHVPILVGGTGLYIDAVTQNWLIPSVEPNSRLRDVIERDLKRDGLQTLVRRLRMVDPVAARRIDTKNPRRLIRALEVALTTGQSFVKQRQRGRPLYRVLKIGVSITRDELRQRLRRRTERMLSRGLVAETKRLLKKYSAECPALSGIGYREVIDCIRGDVKKNELAELITTRSMQYARRQMTWWKRDDDIHWVETWEDALLLVEDWL